MAETDRVLIDSSVWMALASHEDRYHATAVALYGELVESDRGLWTTSFVLLEAGALIHRRFGYAVVDAWHASLAGTVETLWLDEAMYGASWADFTARKGQRFSFVDCSTVLAARALDAKIFAYDSDFALERLPVFP